MADASNGALDELVASTSAHDETEAVASDAAPSADRPSPGTSTDREASRTDPDTTATTTTQDPAPEQVPSRADSADGKTGVDDDGLSPAERSAVDRLSGPKEEPSTGVEAKTHEEPKPGDTHSSKPLSTEDEARLEPRTRKAFAAMRTETKALKGQLAELRPMAEEGTRFMAALDRFEAHDDLKAISESDHIGVVKIQAALIRGKKALDAGTDLAPNDRRILETVAPILDQQLEELGIRAPAKTLPSPYTGYLTEQHKLLMEGGFSEDSVRQLIAIEDAAKAAKSKDGAGQQQPRRAAAPPAARTVAAALERAPAPAASAARPGDAERERYNALNRAFLSERGVDDKRQKSYFAAKILPTIIERLIEPSHPDADATELFNTAKPETRHKLIVMAQDLIEKDAKGVETQRNGQRPPSSPARARQPLSQRDTRGAGVQRRPATGQRSAEDDVVRRLDPQGRGIND